MKLINLFLILSLLVVPAYANDKPPPVTINNENSDHNVLTLVAVIAAGVCIYHKCWQPKPVKAVGSSVPENPQNEYIKVRPR